MDLLEGSLVLSKVICFVSVSSFCYLLVKKIKEKSIIIKGVSQIAQESERFIGKTVKIEGIAAKNIADDTLAQTFVGYGVGIFNRVFPTKANKKNTQSKFYLVQGKDLIKVKIAHQPLISANILEQKSLINKIFSFLTMSSPDNIIFDRKFTVSGINEYIKNNYNCIVRGTLFKGKKGLGILSDTISSHVDLAKFEVDRKFNIAKKVFFASVTIFMMAWIFKKCYNGNLNVFNNTLRNEREPIHQDICLICFDNRCEVIFYPCMHFVTCQKCVFNNYCIICRIPIQRKELIEYT